MTSPHFLFLLGITPDEASAEIRKSGFDCRIVYTKDPRSFRNENVEKKVIRIKKMNNYYEIIAGYFQTPVYITDNLVNNPL